MALFCSMTRRRSGWWYFLLVVVPLAFVALGLGRWVLG
jgi:hypothetical protein